MKPISSDTLKTKPKVKKGTTAHPDDQKKITARRRIEDIQAQRQWEKDWG